MPKSRIENALYAVLASPMIVSFDLSTLNSPKQAFAKSILMNEEMIAINQVRTSEPRIMHAMVKC
jgi:hypothetical protein